MRCLLIPTVQECGEPAANAWCRMKGYDRAVKWKIQPDIGSFSPTKVMIGDKTCTSPTCDGFAWIACERFSDKLILVKACMNIGNKEGAGNPVCEGEQGHNYGKAGRSFQKGENVWILLRLRSIPNGKHVLTTAVNRSFGGKTTGSTAWNQRMEFANTTDRWWYWFKSQARDSGEWVEHIHIDDKHLGYVEYCVDCISWD